MGTAASGDTELIHVTLIDYFSEEILVDNLIEPDVPMQHLNTRYSGVSWADFKTARRRGTCLGGKAGARRAIWRYVGTDTIVVGHGASNDLRSLRWIHASMVDSLVIVEERAKKKEAQEAGKETPMQELSQEKEVFTEMSTPEGSSADGVPSGIVPPDGPEGNAQKTVRARRPRNHSLKTLAKKHLHRDIQMNGKQGHDSLEDAVAARDLVHYSILHSDGHPAI